MSTQQEVTTEKTFDAMQVHVYGWSLFFSLNWMIIADTPVQIICSTVCSIFNVLFLGQEAGVPTRITHQQKQSGDNVAMTFNTPLAVRVLAHIEELNDNDDDLKHNQAMWGLVSGEAEKMDRIYDSTTGEIVGLGACASAMCFAGWANTLEGVKLKWEEVESGMVAQSLLGTRNVDGIKTFVANETLDGEMVAHRAVRLLGIEEPRVCENNRKYNGKCDLDDDDYWEDGVRRHNCACQGPHDGDMPHWNFDEEFPKLFDAENTMEDLYAQVAAFADLEVDELKAMVEDERERFTFDERLLNSSVVSEEGFEISV